MNYSKESVNMALDEIREGGKLNAISAKYGIPESTLRAKVNNKYSDKKPGPCTVLTAQEEQDLEDWVFEMCNRGFPVTKNEFVQSVKMICMKLKRKNPFTDNTPGRHWYEAFLQRHPKIATRIAENVNLNKANLTENSIRLWFQVIHDYLNGMNLLQIYASRIFNADETGVPLNPSHPYVLAPKGHKHVYTIVGNNEKENITVLITASADGKLAPPFIVFKGASLPENAEEFAPDDYTFGYSDNGYMTAPDFYEYVANSFEPWLEREKIQRPVVLYIDGHASHMTMELSKFCADHEIILIALHPNATHMMQPLDVSFFKPFKQQWRICHKEFCRKSSSVGIEKHQVAAVLKDTLSQMNLTEIIPKGFEKCGLFPFNVEAVDFTKVFHRSNNEQNDPETCEEPSVNIAPGNLLQAIEQHIPQATVDSFRLNRSCDWMGDESDRNLYRLWYKLAHPHSTIENSALGQVQVHEVDDGENIENQMIIEIVSSEADHIQSVSDEFIVDSQIVVPLSNENATQLATNRSYSVIDQQQTEKVVGDKNRNDLIVPSEEIIYQEPLANFSFCEADLLPEPQNDECETGSQPEMGNLSRKIPTPEKRFKASIRCRDISTLVPNELTISPTFLPHVTDSSSKNSTDIEVEVEINNHRIHDERPLVANVKKSNVPSPKKEPMDNITNIPGPKEKTSVRKYLAFPSTSGTKKKTRKRRSQPNHPVVSSVEWRSHKQEQIDIQNQKDAETLLRKKIKVEREEASKIKKVTDLRIKKQNKVEKNMIKLAKEREKLRLQQEKMQILERETAETQAELIREKEQNEIEKQIIELKEKQAKLGQ